MSGNPTEEWIKKAEDNYISALDLAQRQRNRVFDVICNQCQQSAEKYLKAILVRHHIDVPKVHDMQELEDLVAKVEPDIRLIHKFVMLLQPYGVDIRYPGLQATEEETKNAIQALKQVRTFARARLGLKTK